MASTRKRVVEFVLRVNDGKARLAMKTTSKSAKQLSEETKGLSGAFRGANRSMAGFVQSNAGLIAGIGASIGVMVAATVAVVKYAQTIADARNKISDFSARTGLSTLNVQALQLAFESSGQSIEDADRALKPYIKLLGDLRAGNVGASKKVKMFGLDLRDANGDIVSNDEAVARLIHKFRGLSDSGEAASFTMGLLGTSSSKLNQAFGTRDLESYTAEIRVHGELTKDAAASADAWQRSTASLAATLRGFSNSLPLGFLTFIVDMLNSLVSGTLVSISAQIDVIHFALVRTVSILTELVSLDFSNAFDAWTDGVSTIVDKLSGIPGKAVDAAKAIKKAQSDVSAESFTQDELALALGFGPAQSSGGPKPTPKPKPQKPDPAAKAAADKAAAEQAATLEAVQGLLAATETQTTTLLSGIVGLGTMNLSAETIASLAEQTNKARSGARQEELGKVASKLSSVEETMSGGLTGILSSLGPAGAIAGSLVSLVLNGEEMLDGILDSALGVVEALPSLLTEVIPAFVGTLISELIPELFALAAQLPIIMVRAFAELLKSLFQGLKDALNPFKGNGRGFLGLKGAASDLSQTLGLGSFDVGSRSIRQSGMAMVHQGERITPPGGGSIGQTAAVGAPSISITINADTLDSDATVQRLIRRLRKALGDRQLGESLTGFS